MPITFHKHPKKDKSKQADKVITALSCISLKRDFLNPEPTLSDIYNHCNVAIKECKHILGNTVEVIRTENQIDINTIMVSTLVRIPLCSFIQTP